MDSMNTHEMSVLEAIQQAKNESSGEQTVRVVKGKDDTRVFRLVKIKGQRKPRVLSMYKIPRQAG